MPLRAAQVGYQRAPGPDEFKHGAPVMLVTVGTLHL